MSLPTEGEVFAQLLEHLRMAQENSATLAHLRRDNSFQTAQGFLAMSEMFKELQKKVTDLAMGRSTGINWSKH